MVFSGAVPGGAVFDGAAPPPGSVVLVDDAHLLAARSLSALAEVAARPDVTLVVAAEPRPANDALLARCPPPSTAPSPWGTSRPVTTLRMRNCCWA